MDEPLNFVFDNYRFLLNDAPFVPLIKQGSLEGVAKCNALSILLPAHPKDDLVWKEQKDQANEAIEKGLFVFWELDLGLNSLKNNFNDPSAFLSHSIALKEFSDSIWKNFRGKTLGVSLYKGPVDFFNRMHWPRQMAEHFEEWLADHALQSQPHGHFLQIFCANIFGEYLHRLASYLPDEANLFCCLDAMNAASRAQLAHILSKDRFEYFHLALKGGGLPLGSLNWERGRSSAGWIGSGVPDFVDSFPTVGILFPNDDGLSLETLSQIDQVLDQLDHRNIPFRIISETYLTEQWNGIDVLVVLSNSLNAIGRRKLQGFCAAGGTVSVIGNPIGLSLEITFQDTIFS
jgi:hypothetical protein